MNDSVDVVVVGAGVIGLAIGWRALQRGLSVRVIERDRPGHGTSYVAGGMIAPISEASAHEPRLVGMARASAALYPRFINMLQYASGFDAGYRECGTLLLARDADEVASLERERELRESLGLSVQRLLPSAAREFEPALAPTLRLALSVPGDHAVDPRALCGALMAAFERAGGELQAGVAAESIKVDRDQVTGVQLAGGQVVGAGQVVVAAGPWSGQIGGLPPEAQIQLRPVKGQVLALRDPAGPGHLERVVRTQGARPVYLVPRGDGRYLLGGTMEERGFDTTVTAGGAYELLRDVTELVPGISEWVIEQTLAGIRPGTVDNLPVIGPSPLLSGLHWATGHFRHGVLLAPLTADVVADRLAGGAPDPVAEPASPARFN